MKGGAVAKKKAVKKSALQGQAAPATQGGTQPTPDQVYVHLPPVEGQAVNKPSFDFVQQYLYTKIQKIYQATQASNDQRLLETMQYLNPMYTQIVNIISWFQNTEIRSIVMEYVRIAESIRFYRTWSTEMQRLVERVRKMRQRDLDMPTRQRLGEMSMQDKSIKVTNDAVDAQIRNDPTHSMLQELQDDWEYLGYQLQNLLDSMQTEMLVQASVWTQRELGLIRESSDPRSPQVTG
jgi:hypothetical protein